MDGSEPPSVERIIKSEDKNNNDNNPPPPSTSTEGGGNLTSTTQVDLSGVVKEEDKTTPTCSIPTINFTHFVSLLSPNNVENCLCCSTSLLLNSGPPPLLPQRKGEILKSFCDILNLPFNPPSRSSRSRGEDGVKESVKGSQSQGQEEGMEEGDDEEDDDNEDEPWVGFPFCFYCTNKKVLLLTMLHQKLEALQAQFDQLKETILKDVVRGFVTNILVDKKLPVPVIRDAKICERMFHLFKRHSERKVKKGMVDSETQTDISSVFTPLMNPAAVASLLENSSSGAGPPSNKRRKPPPKKSESIYSSSNASHFKSWNHHSRHSPSSTNLNNSRAHSDQKYSPLKSTTRTSYYETSNNSPIKNTQTVIEESIVPFDEHLNGGMFPFDDNSILTMGGENDDTYMPSSDYYNLSKPNYVQHSTLNGYSTIDDEFQNALGLTEGYEMGEMGSGRNEGVAFPRTSPLIYTDLDSVAMDEQSPQPDAVGTGRKNNAACEICGKTMLKGTIKMHMEQIHGDEKPYKCRGCDRRFARRDHFNSHEEHHSVNSKRGYFCHRCVDKNKIITGKSSYVGHCMDDHGIEDDVVEYFYFCDKEDCQMSYKVREDFTNHAKSHWKLGESNSCGTCDKIFADKQRLIAHETEAHGRGNSFYDCQFCYMGFEEEEDFSRHLLFHKVKMPEELQHRCDQCERQFETENRLRRHIYRSHVPSRPKAGKSKKTAKADKVIDQLDDDSSAIQNDDDEDDSESIVDKPHDFPCEDCGLSYATQKKLAKHVQKHHTKGKSKSRHRVDDGHSSEDNVPDAGEMDADKEDEDYPSPGPAKRKRRRSGHKATPNINSTGARLTCEFCPLKFKQSIELRRHMVRSHRQQRLMGNREFCIVCFNIFDNKQELQDHYDEKHSKSKCHICKQQLQSATILKQHMERHKAHPFICKLCDHGFATERNLKKHVSISHTKRKDCNGESYSQADSVEFQHDQDSLDLDSVDLFQM